MLVFKTVTALRSDHDDEKLYEDMLKSNKPIAIMGQLKYNAVVQKVR